MVLSISLLKISVAQEERQYAIKSFKSGAKDVMVASGVASKGLDFNDIQHVIIFSMPKEIEDYVHQIGRTGRSGKTGIATTFVNMNTPEQTLLDLKYLLMEAGQKCVCSLVTQVGFLIAYLGCHLSYPLSTIHGQHRVDL
jgi:superfamily II DNA/RNA helicase